jgi:threonine/homoserine/homoserine lactone efflux protein
MLAMAPLLSFMAVAAVALVIPGPDTFVVLRTALADGPRAGTWAAAGSGLGNLVWGTASVLGVAALLAASAGAFAAVKLAGVGYLVYLGAQALRAAARGDALAAIDRARAEVTRVAALRRGLASDLLNVKVGLFWTALVPQFVSGGSTPLVPAAMVVAMGSLVFAWLAAYAHLAARLTRTLRRPGTARTVNGVVGAAFLVLGAGLALARY